MLERKSDIVLRKVGDFYFLIEPQKSYNSEKEDIFQTNEIGAAIWKLLADYHSIDEIHSELISLLNIPSEELNEDLRAEIKEDIVFFVKQLKKSEYVTEA